MRLKYSEIKPGMVCTTASLKEIIIVLSTRLLTPNAQWLEFICLSEDREVFNIYGLPVDEFPHDVISL